MAQRPDSSGQAIEEIAKLARLDLSDERRAVVGPTLDMVNGLVDQLDAVVLVDEPPAAGFNARWE